MRTCPSCGAANRDAGPHCYLCLAPFPSPSAGPADAAPATAPRGGAANGLAPRGAAALVSGPAGLLSSVRAGPMRIPTLSFDDAAAANARNSAVLFLLLFLLLVSLGALAGAAAGSPGAGVAVAALLYAILAVTAWFSGSEVVLAAHGAREPDPEVHRTLLNVVDEVAIAAGIPAPRVRVIESDGLNAFAAGRRPAEGVVAVTTALVERLDREELQGVVAHELAHIRSRDTLYNVCAAVLVGAVALLADTFLRGTLLGGRSGRAPGRASLAYLVPGLLLALIAPLAARLLWMTLSRQREYHADAAAAGFTRNPLGLASALEKISSAGARVPGENRGTRHLFIADPLAAPGVREGSAADTHPPVGRRIQRLKAMAGTA